MGSTIRARVDKTLRYICLIFGVFAFVYYAPGAFAQAQWTGVAAFAILAVITYFLSQLLVPLLDLTRMRRRTGDPGSFVLDAAVYAFVFAVLGGYAAAVLHVVTTLSLHHLRMRYTLKERLLRTAPGIPFWFLFGHVRDLFHHSYEAYSLEGLGAFVLLVMLAHAAYVFAWFDVFFALRTGQRITVFWIAHAKDWVTWMLALAQTAWGYASEQLYLEHKFLLAMASFLPLIGFAFLLRREHRSSVDLVRMQNASAAMDAVLRKADPRPYLRELLESARSSYFNEDLAIYTRAPGRSNFEPVVQAGDISSREGHVAPIQACLWRCSSDPFAYVEVSGDGNWAVYPIHVNDEYFGGLVVLRSKGIDDPIKRAELRRLADDVAPVIANLNEIIATQDAANVDGLTGLLNRAGLESSVRRVFAGAPAQRVALMVDVDYFKAINDTQGHASGDIVLRNIAGIIGENCRGGDVIGRYGGEEFLLILNGVAVESGMQVAERIRTAVAARVNVTVSVGLASHAAGEPPESLIARADAALYDAKRQGRNRCVIAAA